MPALLPAAVLPGLPVLSSFPFPVRLLSPLYEGRIAGAEKKGLMWLIPKDAEKPVDLRYGKKQMTEENK